MPIELTKGQRVNLTKDNPGLSCIYVGLSWDVKEGLDADVDVAVLLLDSDEKLIGDNGIIFYNNRSSDEGACEISPDNRTGEGEGDDEWVRMDLSRVDSRVQVALIVLTTYSDGEPVIFGRVKNASAHVRKGDDKGEVLYEFDLTEDMSNATSMEMAKFYRHGGEWKLATIGERVGTSSQGLADVLGKYNR